MSRIIYGAGMAAVDWCVVNEKDNGATPSSRRMGRVGEQRRENGIHKSVVKSEFIWVGSRWIADLSLPREFAEYPRPTF